MARHGIACTRLRFSCFPDEPARRFRIIIGGSPRVSRQLRRRTFISLLLMCILPQGVGCCLREPPDTPHILGTSNDDDSREGVKQSIKVSTGGYTGGGSAIWIFLEGGGYIGEGRAPRALFLMVCDRHTASIIITHTHNNTVLPGRSRADDGRLLGHIPFFPLSFAEDCTMPRPPDMGMAGRDWRDCVVFL